MLLGVVDFLLKGTSWTVAALRALTLEIINKQPATTGTMKKVRELGNNQSFCIKQTKNVILFLNNKL
jgi:hypothetical protein